MEFTGVLLTIDWICKDLNTAIYALKHGIKREKCGANVLW